MIEQYAHKTLREKELEFEQQIANCKDQLDQAVRETEDIQQELRTLREEKLESNETITTMRLDLERLQTELQNQGFIIL